MILKIGKRFINLDNMTSAGDSWNLEGEPAFKVWFNGGVEDAETFSDEYAVALRSYLDSMAVDVLAVYAEKNKPDCETCGDTGAIAIRGDNDTPCPDCKREGL